MAQSPNTYSTQTKWKGLKKKYPTRHSRIDGKVMPVQTKPKGQMAKMHVKVSKHGEE